MEVWVLGDIRFMYEVFNGIAMMTNHNGWLALIRVGFLLGVILIGLKALIQQKMELHHVMFAFLIYATMFVPRTTVVLTSAYSSGPLGPAIAAVDNVPLGVAFTASLMSKFGKGLTDITEQAFQPIDPSQTSYDGLIAGGYLDPLKELLKLREALYSPVDRDLDYNLREYASNCTARFLQEKRLRVQDIMAAGNAWTAARAPSPVLTTTWSNGGAISERTCQDADADLGAALDRPVHEAVLQRAIATKIGVKDPAEVLNKLQGPFQSIVGAGATAYDYMFNAIMMNYLVSGADLATARSGDMTYSYIVQSARERRDMTHATEKTLFEDIMRPIMTFFEALVFAVAPLMAFLFVIGPAALKFASKYIMMAAWIQLWLPTFAIIKLYTYLALNAQMDSMQVHGLVPGSIEWAWAFHQNLSRWIGISGWLSAATPTISLMFIYGGAVTANSIATRMQSVARESAAQAANTFNPGLLTAGPSGVTAGDTTLQPQLTSDGYRMGLGLAGTQNAAASPLSIKTSESDQVREARTRSESHLKSASSQYVDSLSKNEGFRNDVASRVNASQGLTGTETNRRDAAVNAIRSFENSTGIQLDDTTRAGIIAGAGISAPFGIFSAKAQMDSFLANKGGMSASDKDAVSKQFVDTFSGAITRTDTVDKGRSEAWLNSVASQHGRTSNDSALLQNQSSFNHAADVARAISVGTDQSIEVPMSYLDTYVSTMHSKGDFRFGSGEQLAQHLQHLAHNDLGALQAFGKEAAAVSPVWGSFSDSVGRVAKLVASTEDLKAWVPGNLTDAESTLTVAPPAKSAAPEGFHVEVNRDVDGGLASANRYQGITSEQKIIDDQPGIRARGTAAADTKYDHQVKPLLDQTEQAIAANDAAHTGGMARGARDALFNVAPGKQEMIERQIGAFQDQWAGLGVQMAARASSAGGSGVATSNINLGDTSQQRDLGGDPSKVAELVGAAHAPEIARNGLKIRDLSNDYLDPSNSPAERSKAETALRAELTQQAGGDSRAGDALFEQYKQGANRVMATQQKAADAFAVFEAAPAANLVTPTTSLNPDAARVTAQATGSRWNGYMPGGDGDVPLVSRLLGGGSGSASIENVDRSDIRGLVTRGEGDGGFRRGPDVTPERVETFVDQVSGNLLSAGLGSQHVHGGGMDPQNTLEQMRHRNLGGGTPLDGVPQLSAPTIHADHPTTVEIGSEGNLRSGVARPDGTPAEPEAPPRPAPRADFNNPLPVDGDRTTSPAVSHITESRGPLLTGIPVSAPDYGAPAAREPARVYADGVDRIATQAAMEAVDINPSAAQIPMALDPGKDTRVHEAFKELQSGQASAFRSSLLDMESRRVEGTSVDGEIRELFNSQFDSPQVAAQHYNAYVDSRERLEQSFGTAASRDALRSMSKDGSLGSSGPDIKGVDSVGEGYSVASDAGAGNQFADRLLATQRSAAERLRGRAN